MEVTTENQTTKIRILEAIERINARGDKVTNVSVKNELGGGSFSTISPYVKQWRESQRVTTPTVTLPDHIRERGIQLMGAIYQECEEEAKQDNVKLKQHYEVHITDLEAENDEQAVELARLEKQLSEALTERQAALDHASELKDNLHETELELVSERTHKEAAQNLSSEFKDSWQSAQKGYEEYRAETVKLNTVINNHEKTMGSLKNDAENMKIQLEVLAEDKDKLLDQVDTLKNSNRQSLEELKKANDTIAKLQETIGQQEKTIKELQTAAQDLKTLTEQHQSVKNELGSAKERVRQLSTETGEQKRDMKDLNREIADLNKLNGQLEAKLELQEAAKPEPDRDA